MDAFHYFPDLPVELQLEILFRVDPFTLHNICVEVCDIWRTRISRSSFWTNVLRVQMSLGIPSAVVRATEHVEDWEAVARLALTRPFGRNLLVNCCGEKSCTVEEGAASVQVHFRSFSTIYFT